MRMKPENLVKTLPKKKKWPCLFTGSDTTGEKDFEEFFTEQEELEIWSDLRT